LASRKDGEKKVVTRNRRAKHDYAIKDTYEAGLVLQGTEVKSLREGRATITEGFVQVKANEAWLFQTHIPEYAYGNINNHEPTRPRKLLMKRNQIDKLRVSLDVQGFTGVPMEIYFKDGYAKLYFGIGKGKKHYDKRQDAKAKTDRREMRERY